WLCGSLWPVAVAGAIGYAVCYPVLLGVAFFILPDFHRQWNTAKLWGLYWFGVPLEEIVLSVGFGALWPFSLAYAFDARLVSTKGSTRRESALTDANLSLSLAAGSVAR